MKITFADYIDECIPPSKFVDEEEGLVPEVVTIEYDWLRIDLEVTYDETFECGFPVYMCEIYGINNGSRSVLTANYLEDFGLTCEVLFDMPDWRDMLVADMQEKLAAFVEMFNLKYDEPNYNNYEEERQLSFRIMGAADNDDLDSEEDE